MKDESLSAPKPIGDDQEKNKDTVKASRKADLSTYPLLASSPPADHDKNHPNKHKHVKAANDKSDSEAETVVLSGRDEATAEHARRSVKHEAPSDIEPQGVTVLNHREGLERKNGEGNEPHVGRPSLKRKRAVQEAVAGVSIEAGNSSNLSSTISSPALEARSSKRDESESDRSRSSPPVDEATQTKESRLRKRKLGREIDDQNRKQRGKSDPSSENVASKERRVVRRATNNEVPIHRSESPPLRIHKRAHSSQSNRSESHSEYKRRKAPPPLRVERRRKASEDIHADSDDSSSVHSHPYLQKFALADNHVMSPAKMSHKKYRDKNGRTLLARACSLDFVEAELRLRERPQDLDIPDNAGNTPLQIASLEGKSSIVQLLLDAGCDITCKNIDMETPLIDAVENGHLDVVRMLLKAGLDPRQSNAKGEEPLDLVNSENDHYEAIRAALKSAREKDKIRRPSDDNTWQQNAGARDNDTSSMGASAASPTESLPVQGTKSPPPGIGARRRTARSQPTRDGLLWVNATPENLRNAAGKGDLTIVDHILKMRPKADSESVLAAARGGHEIVIELLIAIGKPNPDPDPLQSNEYKQEFSTPMLAAIGRGNIKVIELLLNQPGFDPTRRLFKGLTYYEIAKERQGSDWQEEYKVLKEAYDNYTSHTAKKSNHGSPRKHRAKRPESHKSATETSPSPLSVGKSQSAESAVLDDTGRENKRESKNRAAFHKHLHVPEVENRDISAIVSDREPDLLGPPKSKSKGARSASDAGSGGSKHSGILKPRRKLLSRNDLKSSQEIKRRASLAEVSSASSQDNLGRASSDPSKLGEKVKGASKEAAVLPNEPGKKRSRISGSPRSIASDIKGSDTTKKKKRRRVDSQGNAVTRDHQRPLQAGPAMVANMITNPKPENLANSTSGAIPGTAPVAFMGTSVTSPIAKSSISPVNRSSTDVPAMTESSLPSSNTDQALQQNIYQQDLQEQRQAKTAILESHGLDQRHIADVYQDEGLELSQKSEMEVAKKAQLAKEKDEEKARIALQELETRLETERQEKEAERQLQIEREEEEARITRKRKDDELQQKQAEQERLLKEEQERQERQRNEQEERERKRKIRIQEEEERQRRESLPNGLRRTTELSPEEARDRKEIIKWLPLFTATTREIDPSCNEAIADERWITNVQAAPILAITDLDLSQCESLNIYICTVQTSVSSNASYICLVPRLYIPLPYGSYCSSGFGQLTPTRYNLVSPPRNHQPARLDLAPMPEPNIPTAALGPARPIGQLCPAGRRNPP